MNRVPLAQPRGAARPRGWSVLQTAQQASLLLGHHSWLQRPIIRLGSGVHWLGDGCVLGGLTPDSLDQLFKAACSVLEEKSLPAFIEVSTPSTPRLLDSHLAP